MPGVAIENGIFVELTVRPDDFRRSALWPGIQVEGTAVGCQEILPVPYALSLRPGARIEGELTAWDAIHGVNTASTNLSYGVYGQSNSTVGGAIDAEGGTLSGCALQWFLDGDPVGTGQEQAVRALELDRYSITLVATDSDNDTAEERVTLYVGYQRLYLPMVIRGQ